MAFLKLLFSGSLMLTVTILNAEIAQETVDNCFPDSVIPLNYEVELIPFFNKDDWNNTFKSSKNDCESVYLTETQKNSTFRGISTITINVTHLTSMRLQSEWIRNMETIDIFQCNTTKQIHAFCMQGYNMDKGKLFKPGFIFLPIKLERGCYIIKITFLNNINNDISSIFLPTKGVFSTSYINSQGYKSWLLASGDMQKFGVQLNLLCWIKSGLKANVIIYTKKEIMYTVLSNNMCKPINVNYMFKNEIYRAQFSVDSATITDLVLFPLNDFTKVSKYKLNINIWCRRRLVHAIYFALDIIDDVTTYLKNEWHMNITKGSENMDYFMLPNFQEEISTSQKLFFYFNEADVGYDDSRSKDIRREIQISQLLTRAIINRWFGLYNNEKSSWLNKGLATLLEAHTIDKVVPNSRMLDLFIVQLQHESMRLDCNYSINFSKIHHHLDIDSHFFSPRYIRIPFILRTLQHLITYEVFRDGIHKYFNENTLNSATPNDFCSAMQAVVNKSNYAYNITQFMEGWTNEYCCLRLTVKFDYYPADSVNFDIENFYPWGMHSWWIPLTYTTQKIHNFIKTSLNDTIWMDNVSSFSRWTSKTEILKHSNPNKWIIVNLQQIGYYRVNYNPKNWQKISHYLNKEEFQKIHVLNRAQIIDDAFHLAIEGKIKTFIFWSITHYLFQETDYVAWYPIFRALEYMSSSFPLSDKTIENIKERFRKLLDGPFHLIKNELISTEDDGLNKYLIYELEMWSCTVGHYKTMEKANLELQLHLKDPEKNKVLPQRKAWTYCNGLIKANNVTWKEVVDVWLQTRDNQILEFLACSQNLGIIIDYIQLIISNKTIIRDNDIICSFHSIIKRHAKDSEVLTYILSHFWTVKPRQVSTVAALIDIITHVYSPQQLVEVYKYAVNNLHETLFSKIDRKLNKRFYEIQKQIEIFISIETE